MNNLPCVKLGVVAVSRDCFPLTLSQRRRDSLTAAYNARYGGIEKIPTIIENETDAVQALEELVKSTEMPSSVSNPHEPSV